MGRIDIIKHVPSHLISCTSKSPPDSVAPKRNPSLSDQLKPLTTVILPSDQSPLLTKPKSTWVNPTKPRRSVLSLQRQKRSTSSYNPNLKRIREFLNKLNECSSQDRDLAEEISQIPLPITKDDALLVLNGLKSWEKAYFFVKWMKRETDVSMETIMYNVAMKSLRQGKQFGLIEELAEEMETSGLLLDNITYSTIISCAKRCERYDKAVEWFEKMYKTGLMPDEVTYSAVLDVYAKLGKAEEAMSLYERGVASGWNPDPVAFAVLARMFGEAGDHDGVMFVMNEAKKANVKPTTSLYYSFIEAMGRAGKPGGAKAQFEEMIERGIAPDVKILTAVLKIYGRFRWGKDAMELWGRIKGEKWPVDLFLYNTMLGMCADLGVEDEAERLFEEMKEGKEMAPDSWSYTAVLNVYSGVGKAEKAMGVFEEMERLGIKMNVMGCTCLMQCLGRAGKIDDLVRVYDSSVKKGVKPDDRLCGCLLSIVPLCEREEDEGKVIGCLRKANETLGEFVSAIEDSDRTFGRLKEEFRGIMSGTNVDARRPFCNCLIDICRKKDLKERAHELLYLGTYHGLYPDLHHVTKEEWCLNVRTLSVGAAVTALEEWIGTVARFVQRGEDLPPVFSALAGSGTHKFSHGLGNAFGSHVKKIGAPFEISDGRAGCFVSTREDLVRWIQNEYTAGSLTF